MAAASCFGSRTPTWSARPPRPSSRFSTALEWAGLDHDEGPFYQTKRFDRYQEVIEEMLASGTAYRCYCSKEELEQMRAQQIARGEKPRYDGRWRERTDSRARRHTRWCDSRIP